jgi:hypothetical protein
MCVYIYLFMLTYIYLFVYTNSFSLGGLFSGAAITVLSSPLELVKIQMQLQSLTERRSVLPVPNGQWYTRALVHQFFIPPMMACRQRYMGFHSVVLGDSPLATIQAAPSSSSPSSSSSSPPTPKSSSLQNSVLPPTPNSSASLQNPSSLSSSTATLKPTLRYRNSWHCFQTLVRERGPLVLYSGFAPQVWREALGFGSYFACYEGICRALSPTGKKADVGAGTHFFAGGMRYVNSIIIL